MKHKVRLNERQLHNIVKKTIRNILNERIVPTGESEYNDENWNNYDDNIMAFDVINEHMSFSDLNEIMNATLYDRYDKPVGKLEDLHFKASKKTGKLYEI